MKRFIVIVAALAALYAAYALYFPTYSYRYRMTIEVETPDGLKSASSVLALTWRSQVAIGPRGAVTQVKGEAVFIDLGGGRNLIATLGFGPTGSEDRLEYLAFEAFKRAGRPMADVKTLAQSQGSAPLTGDLIPTLVSFTDLNDPKTARVVRPDEFETVFGQGTRFKRAFIELTNDTATMGIEKRMTWLSHTDRYRTDLKNPFSNTLRFGRPLFIKES